MENGGEKHAHADIFVAHCGFQAQNWDKFKHIDRSLENVLKVVSVLFVARTPSKGTTNGGNLHTSTVQLHGGVPITIPAVSSRSYPCEREESIGMYHYTKSTRSQSLTVVERTISDLRA